MPCSRQVRWETKLRRSAERPDAERRPPRPAQPPGRILLVHSGPRGARPASKSSLPPAFYKENEKNPALELVTVSVDEDWKIVDTWLKTECDRGP